MWTPIDLPAVSGRILAVSIPTRDHEDQLMVWSESGLYLLRLGRRVHCRKVRAADQVRPLFDPARGGLVYRGKVFPVHGRCGSEGEYYGEIPRCELPNGDRLEVDGKRKQLLIMDRTGNAKQIIDDFPLSKGGADPWWAVAGFSLDGRYLVVAHPRCVRVFRATDEPP